MITSDDQGGRIVFSRGMVSLAPPEPTPVGWAAARFSIVSPGTELRRLAATVSGDDYAAGYMTVAHAAGGHGLHIAPVPHGAPTNSTDPRALPIPARTYIEHVAAARFQLMASLGIARCLPWIRDATEAVVVGAGPVALGCVLELQRVGVRDIQVVTRHPRPPMAVLGGVRVRTQPSAADSRVVIDCTSGAAVGLKLVTPGGLLGLLGTPSEAQRLPTLDLHRRGITVVGMHELVGDQRSARAAHFEEVLCWVTDAIDVALARSWCKIIPGESAVELYEALRGAKRPIAPFLILEWS